MSQPVNKKREEIDVPMESNCSDLHCKTEDAHDAIEQLFQACMQLQQKTSGVTQDEVEALTTKACSLERELSKKIEAQGKPIVRLFSRLRMFSEYFKIRRLQKEIRALQSSVEKTKEQSVVERIIWQITRKGFTCALSDSEILTAFQTLEPTLEALGCEKAFVFRITSRQTGSIDFFLFEEGCLSCHAISLTHKLGSLVVGKSSNRGEIYDSADSLIAAHARDAICLSQLEDVSMWLKTHGVAYGMPQHLHSKAIEEKLTKLMDSCPHGAYILYPEEQGKLKLSRLLHHGGVHHFTIDLTKHPGSYTFALPGSCYSASRTEFKRKLEQMGTPVKLRS